MLPLSHLGEDIRVLRRREDAVEVRLVEAPPNGQDVLCCIWGGKGNLVRCDANHGPLSSQLLGLLSRPLRRLTHTEFLVQCNVIMFSMAFVHAPYFIVRKMSASRLSRTRTAGSLPFHPLVHEAMNGPGMCRKGET